MSETESESPIYDEIFEKIKDKKIDMSEFTDKSVLTMNWEDVLTKFDEMEFKPSIEQLKKACQYAFENFGNECVMNAFWTNIEYACYKVKEESKKEKKN